MLLQAGLAEFLVHARQELSIVWGSQANAALAVMEHVLHLHLHVVKASCEDSQLALDVGSSTS